MDGVKVSPVRGFTGYVGDFLGVLVGGAVGGIIGVGLYFPDLFIRGISLAYTTVCEQLDHFATAIANSDSFITAKKPEDYLQKQWCISTGTLGLVIALPFYAIARTVEYFITPKITGISDFLWYTGGIVGGVIGSAVALPLYPVKHVADRLVDLYKGFRNTVRSITAFIYAKASEEPLKEEKENCCTVELHSNEFREQIEANKKLSATAFIYHTINPNVSVTEEKEQAIKPTICEGSDILGDQGLTQRTKKPLVVKQDFAPLAPLVTLRT